MEHTPIKHYYKHINHTSTNFKLNLIKPSYTGSDRYQTQSNIHKQLTRRTLHIMQAIETADLPFGFIFLNSAAQQRPTQKAHSTEIDSLLNFIVQILANMEHWNMPVFGER